MLRFDVVKLLHSIEIWLITPVHYDDDK